MTPTIQESPEVIQGGPETFERAQEPVSNVIEFPAAYTRPDQNTPQLTPEEETAKEEQLKYVSIHLITESVERIYDGELKELLTSHYEELNSQPLFKKIPRVIYRDFIKPPSKFKRAPYTKYDVTKSAADIGGRLLKGGDSDEFEQKFFLSIEGGLGTNEGASEWVLTRSRGSEVYTHIHYRIDKDAYGNPVVYKYFGSGLVHREESQYTLVKGDELEDLLQAVRLFKDTISREWGVVDKYDDKQVADNVISLEAYKKSKFHPANQYEIVENTGFTQRAA